MISKGHRLLTRENLASHRQAIYQGFVKEARHDADLYRLYHKVAKEIHRVGGKVRRVVLDYELKQELYKKLSRVPPDTEALQYFGYTEEQAQFLYLVATHSGYTGMQKGTKCRSKRLGKKPSASEIPYFRIYDLSSTYATRLSAGGAADEWVTQMLRQGDAEVFKKVLPNEVANEPGSFGEDQSSGQRDAGSSHFGIVHSRCPMTDSCTVRAQSRSKRLLGIRSKVGKCFRINSALHVGA